MRSIKQMEDDTKYIERTLQLAEQAFTAEEVPVGALFVLDGEIIAEAHNGVETTPGVLEHAELRVIREASAKLSRWRLTDGTLYCSLEPCVMCAAAIRTARVSRVVYGAPDIRLGGFGSCIDLTETSVFGPPPEIRSGVCAEESAALLRKFFQERRD